MNRRRAQSGFTLVEMIVALIVVSLLVTLVYGALRTGMRSWEASQEQVEKLNAMRIGWNFIHQALANARQVNDPGADEPGLLFYGEKHRLGFVSDMPSHLGLGGRYLVEILQTEELDQPGLLFKRTLLSDYEQLGQSAPHQQAVLSDQLKTLSFNYFGQKADDDESTWHADWLEQRALPSLVRVNLEEAGGSRWPVLIAQLRFSPNPQMEQSQELEQDQLQPVEAL